MNASIKITDFEVVGDIHGDFTALGDEQGGQIAIGRLVVNDLTSGPFGLYGDVRAPNGRIGNVVIYRGDFGTGANEVDLTSHFDVVMHPGGDPRKVQIVPDTQQFKPKYRYRLVPITSGAGTGETELHCDDLLAGTGVPVKGRDYWVDVDITFAMLDMGNNGWVDAPDAAAWANSPEDFNGDGAADATDLQFILDNLGEPVD